MNQQQQDGVFDFRNVIPSEFLFDHPTTTVEAIRTKYLNEIQPQSQQNFGPSGQSGVSNIMEFQIASNTSVAAMAESYLKFDLNVQTNTSGSIGAAYFPKGGAHRLFKRVTVKPMSGSGYIEDSTAYNMYYVLKSKLLDAPEIIRNLGPLWCETNIRNGEVRYGEWVVASDRFLAKDAVDSESITMGIDVGGTEAAANTELQLGDEVHIQNLTTAGSSVGGGIYGIIESYNNASDFFTITIVHNSLGAGGGIADNAALRVVYRRKQVIEESRDTLDDDTDTQVILRPLLAFNMHNWPLFLMAGGIRITFELEDPQKAFSIDQWVAAEDEKTPTNIVLSNFEYTVKNPRYMVMMLEPQDAIKEKMMEQYQSEMGLIFNMPGYDFKRHTMSANWDSTINSHDLWGVRSGRRIFSFLQSTDYFEGSDPSVYVNDSIGHMLRANIYYFQYKFGSRNYPNRPVEWTKGQDAMEAYLHLQQVVNQPYSMRINMAQWMPKIAYYTASGSTVGYHRDTDSFIMAADLSRDNGDGSHLTGEDMTNVTLQLEVRQDSSGTDFSHSSSANTVLWHFLEYDKYYKLQATDTAVVY